MEHLLERPLQQQSAAEPVVPIAEAGEPGLPGQFGLGGPDLGDPEIVEAQFPGEVGLDMAMEERPGPSHVGPLREPGSPPSVILGNGVKLWEIVGEYLHGVAMLSEAQFPAVRRSDSLARPAARERRSVVSLSIGREYGTKTGTETDGTLLGWVLSATWPAPPPAARSECGPPAIRSIRGNASRPLRPASLGGRCR